jgi:RNA processing factor Prp31
MAIYQKENQIKVRNPAQMNALCAIKSTLNLCAARLKDIYRLGFKEIPRRASLS